MIVHRLIPALAATALLAGLANAATLVYTTTVSQSSHSATVYDPTFSYFVQVSVPNNTDGTVVGKAEGIYAVPPNQLGVVHDFGFPNTLLPALNDPTYPGLNFLVDHAVSMATKPIFSAPITSFDFVPLALTVSHPAGGGTDVSSQTQFNFYNDANVPEPSTAALLVIGCVVALVVSRH